MQNLRCSIRVWGDFACFTRPEFKVERFSYPVITPSAARGIFDAIYWKPGFYWQISRIKVLKEPKFIALRRNEVKEKAPNHNTILGWAAGEEVEPILADGSSEITGSDAKGRTQRQTTALHGVEYVLEAEPVVYLGQENQTTSIVAQFSRRVEKGQCAWQPTFGCREFACYYSHCPFESRQSSLQDREFGLMLYDVFDLRSQSSAATTTAVSFYRPTLRNGEIVVPPYTDSAVFKPEVRQ